MRIDKWTAAAMLVILTGVTSAGTAAARAYGGEGMGLFVSNDGWHPVDVFVERAGAQDSLGRVWRHQYVRFDLPEMEPHDAPQLVVRLVSAAGDTFRTESVRTRSGRVIDVRIQTPLRHSRWRRH
jgi:hypothetical protein